MTSTQLKALDLTRGDECEVRDKSAIKHNSVCFRRLRFRRMHKTSRSLFHADWLTRHEPEEMNYEGKQWCSDGVFDCGDLVLVGEVQRATAV